MQYYLMTVLCMTMAVFHKSLGVDGSSERMFRTRSNIFSGNKYIGVHMHAKSTKLRESRGTEWEVSPTPPSNTSPVNNVIAFDETEIQEDQKPLGLQRIKNIIAIYYIIRFCKIRYSC